MGKLISIGLFINLLASLNLLEVTQLVPAIIRLLSLPNPRHEASS